MSHIRISTGTPLTHNQIKYTVRISNGTYKITLCVVFLFIYFALLSIFQIAEIFVSFLLLIACYAVTQTQLRLYKETKETDFPMQSICKMIVLLQR